MRHLRAVRPADRLNASLATLLASWQYTFSVRVKDARQDHRRGDGGALNTLEMVVLALGGIAIAAIFVAAARAYVTSHLAQIK